MGSRLPFRNPARRAGLVAALAKRGYNANMILDTGWDQQGYYLVVPGSNGKPLLDGNGVVQRVWQFWDDPSDYELVRDWFEGRV